MNGTRAVYSIAITINGLNIDTVVIDSHYREKHSSSINDELILKLIHNLDGENFRSIDEKYPFKYFAENGIELYGKSYRLIWLLEENQSYIGVINAFRSSK